MIGLDTNVVVRHLVHDDPHQSEKATRAFQRLTPGEPGFLTTVVLVETYWVLTRGYHLEVSAVLRTLESLVDSGDITTQDVDCVRAALSDARQGADFADALIGRACRAHGCTAVLSFDRTAQRPLGFQSPISPTEVSSNHAARPQR